MAKVLSSNNDENKTKLAIQVAQQLRNDLHLLSNEARKKYPAVREAAERGAMRLKNISEQRGFTLAVLSSTDDFVHPLLFACESRNPRLVQLALSALQKPIQYNAIPQRSVESIVATLRGLVEQNVEELKVLQTIMLLASSTEHIRGKIVSQVLVTCFTLYSSKDPSVHNTASVAIRQVVQTMFDRLNALAEQGGLNSPEPPPPDSSPSVSVDHRQLPVQVRDAYLLFQDLCFLINGDPSAWLPSTLPLDVCLGLELLEIVLRSYPMVFAKEKLFSVLLTERVCPLVIKLFSPSSKHRHVAHYQATTSSNGPQIGEKPMFSLQIRLLRILGVLIKHYYAYLVMQCEIFLCMLVKFLDSDKPLWQRTLAVEVLHTFSSSPALLRAFCECYDMQEHSTNVFTDVINGLGAFVQSNLSSSLSSSVSTHAVGGSSSIGHISGGSGSGSECGQHLFVFRGVTVQADALPLNSHNKPLLLEMLDKQEVPAIPEGYPLMVAMVSLLDIIKSISLVVNNQADTPPSVTPLKSSLTDHTTTQVSEAMLSSCWSAVLASLAMLLDSSSDDQTTKMVLEAHRLFIQLCGTMNLTAPRDAFLTALCKSALPPKYAMSFVAQPGSRFMQAGSSDEKSRGAESGKSSQARLHAHFDPSKRQIESSSTAVAKKRISYVGEEGGKVLSPTGSGGIIAPAAHPSGVLTPKNVECILTLLHLIHQHGEVLNSAWHLTLTTMQHVAFIVGKAPSKAGSLTLTRPADSSALVLVSSEKRSEMSEVSEKLQDLFTNTRFLSERSVISLVDALCQLSNEALQNHQAKEISLFPVASLLETGMSNLSPDRVELLWERITSHLTMVCNHSDPTVRLFAADSLTHLIQLALEQVEGSSDSVHQLRLLTPLLVLTQTGHFDVRQRQMECVSHILHSSGQILKPSWTTLLDVINAASSLNSDNLVRAGFQSLQLVVTDFLPLLPSKCLPFCVEVTGHYGIQNQDLNISLTSIGLLWNIADYLFQNQSSVQPSLEALRDVDSTLTPPSPTNASEATVFKSHSSLFLHSLHVSSLPVFDAVWMLLFQRLADLCVNEHSAIRKSAAQTLFSTISAHGGLLHDATWQAVIWQVLFSVLDHVSESISSASTSTLISSSSAASSSSTSSSTSFLVHHTRNTSSKQWAETQVIVLGGVARVFQSRLELLSQLDGFDRIWSTLLDNIRKCACSPSNEVAIAAMTSFKLILELPTEAKSPRNSITSTTAPLSRSSSPFPAQVSAKASSPFAGLHDKDVLWERAWLTWQQIGHEVVVCRLPKTESFQFFLTSSPSHEEMDIFFEPLPTQSFLVHLLSVFSMVVRKIGHFTSQQLQIACQIFEAVVLVPVPKDVSPFLVPAAHEDSMTSVQTMVLTCLSLLFTQEDILDHSETSISAETSSNLFRKAVITKLSRSLELFHRPSSTQLYDSIITQLLSFAKLAWSSQTLLSLPSSVNLSVAKLPVVVVNYSSFALSSLVLAVQLCKSVLSHDLHVPLGVVERFVQTLYKPLSLRYRCTTVIWSTSVNAFLLIIECCLSLLLKEKGTEKAEKVWLLIGQAMEDFLFCEVPAECSMTSEDLRKSELLDLKVIELIKNSLLPSSSALPIGFIKQLTSILNSGSIHSVSDETIPGKVLLRENFARSCFEALLQLSFMPSSQNQPPTDSTSQLALHALLERSEQVLKRFSAEERLSGSCPPTRAFMNEVSLVLKSSSVLISSLKQAQRDKGSLSVDPSIWSRVSRLYPVLVECVTCHNMEVRVALKETLGQFTDLLVGSTQPQSDTCL